MIGRRELIVGGLATAAQPALAQLAGGRLYRIGSLHIAKRDAPHHRAFFEGLATAGFVEGRNLIVEPGGYGLTLPEVAIYAASLAARGVDAIVCAGDVGIRAALTSAPNIPVVALADDMLGSNFVRSLAQPGGNLTGVTIAGPDLDGKRQDLLIELLPKATRLGALADSNVTKPEALAALQARGLARGVDIVVRTVSRLSEVEAALDAFGKDGIAGINLLATPLFFNNFGFIRDRLGALPAMLQWPEMARAGGLIAYGPSIVTIYRDQMARLMARVLSGTPAAQLPVELPLRFELVVNMVAARAQGFTVPNTVLLSADEVIE
jgi:putative ABC transport system substrate-binding protein